MEKSISKERITRKIFNEKHVACPDCDNTIIQVSLLGIVDYDDRDYEDNFNTAKCKCGWKGMVRDLLPPKEK